MRLSLSTLYLKHRHHVSLREPHPPLILYLVIFSSLSAVAQSAPVTGVRDRLHLEEFLATEEWPLINLLVPSPLATTVLSDRRAVEKMITFQSRHPGQVVTPRFVAQ